MCIRDRCGWYWLGNWLWWGFEWSSTECRYCWYPAPNGCCHGNTPFCLSMGYNCGCMIASDTLFDSRGGFSGQAIRWGHSQFRGSKGYCHGNHFWLSIYGVHIGATWRIRLNCPCAAAMRPYAKFHISAEMQSTGRSCSPHFPHPIIVA